MWHFATSVLDFMHKCSVELAAASLAVECLCVASTYAWTYFRPGSETV
ncbi:hypothetical protein B0G77_5750 [Paraburkholderia sp. BL10I2N1]|nr:hypothetical protein B0G77_5750 [Paraburkholderia sp. BL10I2N1]